MQRTLNEHIEWLEKKVANLTERQHDLSLTSQERYQAALDLELAERALTSFRKAYELEQRISKL